MYDKLKEFYSDAGPERIGFILKDGTVLEVANAHPTPATGACISADELAVYEGQASGFWHTHPGATCNLTIDDWRSFRDYPDHEHVIIGNNGIARYVVEDGEVIRCA